MSSCCHAPVHCGGQVLCVKGSKIWDNFWIKMILGWFEFLLFYDRLSDDSCYMMEMMELEIKLFIEILSVKLLKLTLLQILKISRTSSRSTSVIKELWSLLEYSRFSPPSWTPFLKNFLHQKVSPSIILPDLSFDSF